MCAPEEMLEKPTLEFVENLNCDRMGSGQVVEIGEPRRIRAEKVGMSQRSAVEVRPRAVGREVVPAQNGRQQGPVRDQATVTTCRKTSRSPDPVQPAVGQLKVLGVVLVHSPEGLREGIRGLKGRIGAVVSRHEDSLVIAVFAVSADVGE